ncbi:MAG: hypothetical protein R3C15_24000 [Thermoleophilia bacterium]
MRRTHSTYSRIRVAGFATSSPCQSAFQPGGAVPSPSTKRPCVSSAIDAAAVSVCIGGRA